MTRRAEMTRKTAETSVEIKVYLDGTGTSSVSTGVGFFDHLLTSFATHSLIDLSVSTDGDLDVDDHHTVEDTALALGSAIAEALGDRSGIARFGDARVPMDEAIATAAIDLSGRSYASVMVPLSNSMIGNFTTQNFAHALEALSRTAGLTLHLDASGVNDHHIAEAAIKALARAFRQAAEIDPRRGRAVPSSKGSL